MKISISAHVRLFNADNTAAIMDDFSKEVDMDFLPSKDDIFVMCFDEAPRHTYKIRVVEIRHQEITGGNLPPKIFTTVRCKEID